MTLPDCVVQEAAVAIRSRKSVIKQSQLSSRKSYPMSKNSTLQPVINWAEFSRKSTIPDIHAPTAKYCTIINEIAD